MNWHSVPTQIFLVIVVWFSFFLFTHLALPLSWWKVAKWGVKNQCAKLNSYYYCYFELLNNAKNFTVSYNIFPFIADNHCLFKGSGLRSSTSTSMSKWWFRGRRAFGSIEWWRNFFAHFILPVWWLLYLQNAKTKPCAIHRT